jgi:hypothetical protein
MNRVEISRPIMGICNMQVCCVQDATDEEILEVCNRLNPAGTTNGWGLVKRDGEFPPVQCQDYPDRLHILVSC